MPAPLDMLCVGHWPQEEVAQHGRILERTRFTRNPGASPHDFLSLSSQRFCDGADGLRHPCAELEHPGLHSVWSQVELKLLQKRSWRVVISPKWKFEDDILSREARALLRGLQVMVSAEHVRNARVLCLTALCTCI